MVKSKKQIYLVYSCDGWKSNSSMGLLMATTSVRRLKAFVAKEIADGNMDYSNGITETPKRMSEKFKKDFDIIPRDNINNNLAYGFIDYCYDGEEI